MNYRITEQYSKTEETLVAEFNVLNDAHIFLTQKLSSDAQERIARIYRLYDDDLITQTFNQKNISVGYAQFAEGSAEIGCTARFCFKVMLQMDGNIDQAKIANFNHIEDATLFIISKCEVDKTVHDDDLFIIYNGKYVLDRLNRASIANQKKEVVRAGQNNNGLIFHPAPLQTTLKPLGFPKDYWVDEESDD